MWPTNILSKWKKNPTFSCLNGQIAWFDYCKDGGSDAQLGIIWWKTGTPADDVIRSKYGQGEGNESQEAETSQMGSRRILRSTQSSGAYYFVFINNTRLETDGSWIVDKAAWASLELWSVRAWLGQNSSSRKYLTQLNAKLLSCWYMFKHTY